MEAISDMSPAMREHTVKKAVAPLQMIFWGGLLLIFDFNLFWVTNGEGFKFDLLNDVLASIMIAVGVSRLSALPVHDGYAQMMRFVKVVSVLAVLDAFRDQFIMQWPLIVYLALSVFGLVTLAAMVVFCIAMRRFCENANLPHAARSWSMTTTLFVVIYILPLAPFYIITALALLTGTGFDGALGVAMLLILPVFAIPLIHLFVSTSRMKRAAETVVAVY